MAKPRNKYPSSLIVVFLRITVVLGVSNHFYDPETHQLIFSSAAFIYRSCLHTVALIVMFWNIKVLLRYIVIQLGEKPFLSELSFACMCVNMCVNVSALTSDWWSRGRATRPYNELLSVSIDASLSPDELAGIRKHAWKLFFLKSLLAASLVVTSFVSVSTNPWTSVAPMLSTLGLNFAQLNFLAFRCHFSMAMIYGGYLFKVLNLRLSRVVTEINDSLCVSRRNSRRLRDELRTIGALHTSLLDLMIRVKDVDQFHLLVMFVLALLYQVGALFYMFLAMRGLYRVVTVSMVVFLAGNTFLSSIDLLVSLYICGECVDACDAAGSVLKDLRFFLVLDKYLERDIDVLSLQFAREKLHLTLCGMFDLNAHTGPGMFKGIMMNLILLTQLAYDEIH